MMFPDKAVIEYRTIGRRGQTTRINYPAVCSSICVEIKSPIVLRYRRRCPRSITNGRREIQCVYYRESAGKHFARIHRPPLLSIVSAVSGDLYPCRPDHASGTFIKPVTSLPLPPMLPLPYLCVLRRAKERVFCANTPGNCGYRKDTRIATGIVTMLTIARSIG